MLVKKQCLDVLIPVSNSLLELQNETDLEKVANNINNVAKMACCQLRI